MLTVTKTFEFAASHFLTKYHGKCENLHGHNYKLAVTVVGELQDNDLVYDFVALKKIVNDMIIEKLDHTHLNEIFENPSAEVMAVWVWEELEKELPLYEIRLWETDSCFVTYRGKNGFHST